MSVTDGQPVNAAITNAAFVSKTSSSDQGMAGRLVQTNTTASSSKDTGAIVTDGGLGVEKSIYAGIDINAVGDLIAGDDVIAGGDVTAVGNVTGANLSGTNTGNVTVAAFDTVETAEGLAITGQALKLTAAGASFPGGVSTAAQSFGGLKSFPDGATVDTKFSLEKQNVASEPSFSALTNASSYLVISGGDAVALYGIDVPSTDKFLIIENGCTQAMTLHHESGSAGSAAARMLLPGDSNVTIGVGEACALIYSTATARWILVSGGGGLTTGAQTISGLKTFDDGIVVNDELCFEVENAASEPSTNQLTHVASVVQIAGGDTMTINGIAAPTGPRNKLLLIQNSTGNPMTLAYSSGSAIAADRIVNSNASDYVLPANGIAILMYLTAYSRWFLCGSLGGSSKTIGSSTALTAGGTISISTSSYDQTYLVAGNSGAVTLSNTPFGTTPPPNGGKITLIGNSITNTVTINKNDAADGCVFEGDSIELTKYSAAVFEYNSTLDRYVLLSFQP